MLRQIIQSGTLQTYSWEYVPATSVVGTKFGAGDREILLQILPSVLPFQADKGTAPLTPMQAPPTHTYLCHWVLRSTSSVSLERKSLLSCLDGGAWSQAGWGEGEDLGAGALCDL